MTPPMATNDKKSRRIRKRYPAPLCPECGSDETEVTHTEAGLRRFRCDECKHRWKKERPQ